MKLTRRGLYVGMSLLWTTVLVVSVVAILVPKSAGMILAGLVVAVGVTAFFTVTNWNNASAVIEQSRRETQKREF